MTNYEEVLRRIYSAKWKKTVNKEKLRLLLFECHFHCAVALQNFQNYPGALRHFTEAMKVVSWRKDECRAGCITGRVLHLHVPTLARIACCYIHQGQLKKALESTDQAILLDFRNPDLYCVRSLVNFLLHRQKKALSDASYAIQLNSKHVCGWLLRGLLRKLKRGLKDKMKERRQEPDLIKACEINPDAMMFVNISDMKDQFQIMFDRLLPSIRVSHTLSVRDVIVNNMVSNSTQLQELSSKIFICGVAKPYRQIIACPTRQNRHSDRFLERCQSEPSMSYHKQSMTCNVGLIERPTTISSSDISRKSFIPQLTLKDVVSVKGACICRKEKIIGKRYKHCWENGLQESEDISYLEERMYSRKWLQDQIPTKIPDMAGCRKLP